jgi:hypothetical protein
MSRGLNFMLVWNIYLEKTRDSMIDGMTGAMSEDLHIQTKYQM